MKEKIIERIRRLLALAKSSNEFEAAAAAAKAQELLLKYNLEAADLKEPEEAVEREDVDASRDTWRSALMNAIALTSMCRVVRTNGKLNWAVFGKPGNIEVVKYLYTYLEREILKLTPGWRGPSYANSFRHGCVSTIAKRLREGLNNFNADPNAFALIKVNDAAVAERVAADFPKLHASTARPHSNGFADGKAAGETIAINRGLGKNQMGQLLLK